MDPFTTVESWSRKQDATSHLAPSRQEPFIGVQPPNCVEAEAEPTTADEQTKLTDFESKEDKKKKAWRGAAKNLFEQGLNTGDVSGDAPDGMQWAQQTCGDFMKKVEANEFRKESKEHPTFSSNVVKQIVKDHAVSATAENPSGASGSISTSGGGMELGPLKMRAPNINAGGQADKETMGTITKAAGVAAGNPAAAIADNSRRLGGQIMYDQRYEPLSLNKGKMGEKSEFADGIGGLAGIGAGILTGNPLIAATVGGAGSAAEEMLKKDGDPIGAGIRGAGAGFISGAGTGIVKGLAGTGAPASTAAASSAPSAAPASSATVPGGISSNVDGSVGMMKPPAPTTDYNLPRIGKGAIPTPTPVVPEPNLQHAVKSPAIQQAAQAGISASPAGPLKTAWDTGTKLAGDFGKWANAPATFTDISDGVPTEDAVDKFMRKHTSEEEMLNNAIPAKKSPAPEDLGQKINKKSLRPGADDSDKMLLTSAGCKQ